MDTLLTLLRAALGMAALVGICWLASSDRRAINWKLVGSGLLLQVVLAVLILRVPFVLGMVENVSEFFRLLVGFSDEGARMIFGTMPVDVPVFGMAWSVLSAIVFFSALSAVLYHLRILQAFVYLFALLLAKTMKLSGAECLAAAANVFIGQTEAPLVVRPYLKMMNSSEINSLMTGGMATIAGGVLVIYMGMLGGADDAAVVAFGKHLLTASILSAPAALVAAKIIAPQTESVDQRVVFPKESQAENLLDAATKGTTDGLKLALNVGAMLIAFTGLLAVLNYLVGSWIGSWTGLNDWVAGLTEGRMTRFDFSFVIGALSAPFALIMGVSWGDCLMVGQLLGERLVLNEFFAYLSFTELKDAGAFVDERSILVSTYALCGFANITSIGIQVGGISVIESSQRANLLANSLKALLGGLIACYMTATLAGVLG